MKSSTKISGNRPGIATPLAANPEVPELSELSELSASKAAGDGMDGAPEVPLSMLLDLTLAVSIELGRTTMTVQEILRLGRGSVIQLDRVAGEPIDVFVGERRFAEGEVVVLGEYFGVRITRIVSPVNVEQLAS
jgi:flagellar motor switch protein FliN